MTVFTAAQRNPARLNPTQLDPTDPISPAFRTAVDAAIATQLARAEQRLTKITPQATQLTGLASQLLQGGKRMRPAFAFWGYLSSCDPLPGDLSPIVAASAAFELLHVGILVHDDLIDDSDTRRGLPSAHRAFQASHPADSVDYGRAQAVILGDEIISWADEALWSAGLAPDQLANALPYWWTVRTEVNAGQFLDIANQFQMLSEFDAISAARLVLETKTAKYTVVRPLQFGAALAGADQQLVDALADFGAPLGRAFQLRDDLLGVFADEQQIGKPAGDDLREGKATVLLAHALANSPHADELGELIGNPNIDDAALARARNLIIDSGSVAAVEAEIDADWRRAQDLLVELPITQAGQLALRQLAKMAVDRLS